MIAATRMRQSGRRSAAASRRPSPQAVSANSSGPTSSCRSRASSVRSSSASRSSCADSRRFSAAAQASAACMRLNEAARWAISGGPVSATGSPRRPCSRRCSAAASGRSRRRLTAVVARQNTADSRDDSSSNPISRFASLQRSAISLRGTDTSHSIAPCARSSTGGRTGVARAANQAGGTCFDSSGWECCKATPPSTSSALKWRLPSNPETRRSRAVRSGAGPRSCSVDDAACAPVRSAADSSARTMWADCTAVTQAPARKLANRAAATAGSRRCRRDMRSQPCQAA